MSLLAEDHLVAGDAHVKLLVDQAVVDELMPLVLGSLKHQDIDFWGPARELALPVVKRGFGYDDEVWSGDVLHVAQVAQESDGLQRFAQPHLVGKDARDPVLVQRDEPIQAGNLVVPHLAALDKGGRLAEDRLGRGAMLLVLEQLSILLLLGATPTFDRGTSRTLLALLGFLGVLFVLLIDLGDDLFDARIRVGLDEVPEQVGQPQQIAESSNRVILLGLVQPVVLLAEDAFSQRTGLGPLPASVGMQGIAGNAAGGRVRVGVGVLRVVVGVVPVGHALVRLLLPSRLDVAVLIRQGRVGGRGVFCGRVRVGQMCPSRSHRGSMHGLQQTDASLGASGPPFSDRPESWRPLGLPSSAWSGGVVWSGRWNDSVREMMKLSSYCSLPPPARSWPLDTNKVRVRRALILADSHYVIAG